MPPYGPYFETPRETLEQCIAANPSWSDEELVDYCSMLEKFMTTKQQWQQILKEIRGAKPKVHRIGPEVYGLNEEDRQKLIKSIEADQRKSPIFYPRIV